MSETTVALDCLIDRYIAIWNETDPDERRDLIARTWTDDAQYLDPLMSGDGPAGIDAMVAGVQARFPDHRFRRTGGIDAYHCLPPLGDRVRFSWELAAEGQPPLAAGLDVGVVAHDGRLQSITGFLDPASGPRDGA